MKQLFFFIFVLGAVSLNSCNTAQSEKRVVSSVINTYPDGRPQTIHLVQQGASKPEVTEIHYYPSGQKKIEGHIVNGKREGLWKSFYENGDLWSVGEFTNDRRHGKAYLYYPGGKKKMEGTYRNGQRTNDWQWWDEEGNAISEEKALLQ